MDIAIRSHHHIVAYDRSIRYNAINTKPGIVSYSYFVTSTKLRTFFNIHIIATILKDIPTE